MSVRPPRILAPDRGRAVFDALDYEIMQEKASALGRVTAAFEKALAAYSSVQAADDAAEAEREESTRAAADALWCFVVQREACGLGNTEAVLREYKVPKALRLRMGVSRRS